MSKKSFVMYDSWATLIANIPSDQAGELIQAICCKKIGKGYEITDPTVAGMFAMIAPQLDLDDEKYVEKCERLSKARQSLQDKSVLKKDKSELKNNKSVLKKDKSDGVSVSDSESDSESDSVSESENVHPTDAKKKDAQARPVRHKHGRFGHVLLTDDQLSNLNQKHGEAETQKAIQTVDDYCEQSGKTYKNYALVMEKWGYKSAAENARSGTTRPGGFDANDYLLGIINGGET